MMIVGFFGDFVLFIIPAFNFKYYTSKQGVHAFQAMYFLSSFFNQFGPNSVTFLVAAEVYPTPIRATAHGFSAAVGKLGALTAAVLYNYIDTQMKFYVVPWFGLAGALLTWVFLPDTTGLDLKEQERRWQFIRSGHEEDYHVSTMFFVIASGCFGTFSFVRPLVSSMHMKEVAIVLRELDQTNTVTQGIAIHPKHLSVWERFRGVGKHYDPDLDYKQKVEEMRGDWEEWQAQKTAEKEKGDLAAGLDHAHDFDDYSDDVHSYFNRTAKNTPMMEPMEKKENHSDDSVRI
jgi:hypothetical protein